MSDNGTNAALTLSAILAYILGGIHLASLFGAIIGSFFYLVMPSTVSGLKGFLLWVVSVGFGYYLGAWIEGPASGFMALLGGAVGVLAITAFAKYVDGGPMPDFLEQILSRVPWLAKKRNGSDV